MYFYLVVWGGAYEAPSYVVKTTEAAAWKQAAVWMSEIDGEPGDWVDVLRINHATLQIERLHKDKEHA